MQVHPAWKVGELELSPTSQEVRSSVPSRPDAL